MSTCRGMVYSQSKIQLNADVFYDEEAKFFVSPTW